MPELSVFFVGLLEHELAACAERTGQRSDVRRFESPRSAVAYLARAETAPDLIVLVESRPGQFSNSSIHELRRRAPLARVWRLLGSWCEGEKRTAKPPVGCTSSLWHQWQPRALRAVARARAGNCPPWGLPVTSTPDEQNLDQADQPLTRGSGTIVICAHHAETASALADACRLGGYDAKVVRQGEPLRAEGARALLWDMPLNHLEQSVMRKLRVNAGGAPIFALMSFPRAEDIERALEAGIAGVISKPFLLRDLLWHFEQIGGDPG